MKLKRIEIKGWRSFDCDEGIVIDDIRRVNLIIGRNNVGKSNVFKYFYYLKEVSESLGPNGYGDYNNITDDIEERNTWAFLKKDVMAKLSFSDFQSVPGFKNIPPTSHTENEVVELISNHYYKQKKLVLSLLDSLGKPHLENLPSSNPKVLNTTTGDYENYKESIHLNATDTISYWQTFFKSLIFIDPIRHHSRKGMKESGYYFQGSDIINKLDGYTRDEIREMRKFQTKMNIWLEDILGEKVDFNVNQNLQVLLTRDGEEINESLDTLGTGVGQVFMLLSYLYWNKDQHLNVFLEEPENNIHPEALVVLVKILETEFKNHTYFISTHSASLIDQVNEHWTISHMTQTPKKSSKVTKCNEVIEHFQLLDDLGYRASQLIQSNIVIWVEGPSDRIYINKWIHLLSEGRLIEHQHYSFLMYGGSNLSSYDLFENEENIGMLKMSRYAVVVCDSDRKTSTDTVKGRVQKIYNQLRKADESTLGPIDTSCNITDYVYLWITSGKEIENYIPNDLFTEAISNDSIRKHRINSGSDSILSLDFDKDAATRNKLGEYDVFTKHFCKFYKSKSGTALKPNELKNIETHLNKKKVEISKAIAQEWGKDNFSSDLETVILNVIQLVRTANNIN